MGAQRRRKRVKGHFSAGLEDKILDSLGFEVQQAEAPEKLTKRILLSQVQKLFDPLGFLSPILNKPKLLIQRAWAAKSGWGEALEEELKQEFLLWREQLPLLKQVWMPRWVSEDEATS